MWLLTVGFDKKSWFTDTNRAHEGLELSVIDAEA
jgi:hypothetical protein